jgi:excinuclease ABC subunit A
VIERNLDVIKTADWVIDLGPEGGSRGGSVLAAGPPEQVAQIEESYTGQYLSKLLGTPHLSLIPGRVTRGRPCGRSGPSLGSRLTKGGGWG